MKFERTIAKISNYATLLILYVLCAGTYMSAKGFVYDNGKISLIREAKAEQTAFAEPLAKRSIINLSDPHFLGDPYAPITIYEYSSFGCSHCADFHLRTIKKLQKDYIEKGKVKIALVYFPIDKKSMQAAMIASCIPDNEYHDFVNTVFNKQREWALSTKSDEVLAGYAALHGISRLNALECTKNDAIASEILGNRQQGITDFKISGTPTFVVDDGTTQEIIYGAPSFSNLKTYLDEKLSKI